MIVFSCKQIWYFSSLFFSSLCFFPYLQIYIALTDKNLSNEHLLVVKCSLHNALCATAMHFLNTSFAAAYQSSECLQSRELSHHVPSLEKNIDTIKFIFISSHPSSFSNKKDKTCKLTNDLQTYCSNPYHLDHLFKFFPLTCNFKNMVNSLTIYCLSLFFILQYGNQTSDNIICAKHIFSDLI